MPDPLGNVNNWLFVRKPEPQGAQQPQPHLPMPGYAALVSAELSLRRQLGKYMYGSSMVACIRVTLVLFQLRVHAQFSVRQGYAK